MNSKLKGTLCGIGAAVCYGMNPLGALPLYADGINTDSVLFYRYAIAAVILGLFMLAGRKSFAVTKKEIGVLGLLGILFSVSSLTLFTSFHFMDAGVASTLLFVYPVMVAVIMALFFRERITGITVFSILMSLADILLLYRGKDGTVLSTAGVMLVMLSSLTYALYIVVVNKSSLHMSSMKLTFYVLVFSLLLMVVSVNEIGSTPTAVIGALEPLTAVVIGVAIFGEQFTSRLAVGILLILSSVILIVLGNSISLNRITMVIGRFGHVLAEHWR